MHTSATIVLPVGLQFCAINTAVIRSRRFNMLRILTIIRL